MIEKGREKETESGEGTERGRENEREKERERRDRQRKKERKTERERDRQTDTQREKHRERGTRTHTEKRTIARFFIIQFKKCHLSHHLYLILAQSGRDGCTEGMANGTGGRGTWEPTWRHGLTQVQFHFLKVLEAKSIRK